MISKIKISGYIKTITGLAIGGSGETAMIGSVDSTIVRDSFSNLPIIPGSSFKGKLRYLLAKDFDEGIFFGNNDEPNKDPYEITRLFGSSEENNLQRSRLQFTDSFLSNESKEEFDSLNIPYTEIKTENTIDRLTAVANPRQIERVTRGSKFDFEILYNVEEVDETEEDFHNLSKGFKLLEYDYLGSGGSRGNGRVKIVVKDIETVIGDYDSSKLKL